MQKPSPQPIQPVLNAIDDTSNLSVSNAAWMAAEMRRPEFIVPLLSAFDRFKNQPLKMIPLASQLNALLASGAGFR